ncbi:MAG: hypothetical protein KYX63_00170 [Alteromonas macleodii]|nr:hypothetical protein [Alteromonas macleodii]
MTTKYNGYIEYLNSLHNVSPSGANALAESQALNDYFPEVYEPLPIVDHVAELLRNGGENVVILTGHAGDGKSTVALDIYKRLSELPLESSLKAPLREREELSDVGVNIVKDMSELSSKMRVEWLSEAFLSPGSWLIVSNTGPLLSSLLEFKQRSGEASKPELVHLESNILRALDRPLEQESSAEHVIEGFAKDLIILNLTKLDNVNVGSRLLTKLVEHSAWSACEGCQARNTCPIKKNHDALTQTLDTTERRVRWLYTRLNAYEHRLTLRQIIGHLSYSITGGKNCIDIIDNSLSASGASFDQQDVLFSESFFGMRNKRKCDEAHRLHAVSLLSRLNFGAPIGIEFERNFESSESKPWFTMPSAMTDVYNAWSSEAKRQESVRTRFALRRMQYIFGIEREGVALQSQLFFDDFLQSLSARDFDRWKALGTLDLSRSDRRKLCELCLKVLLEFFTGFSANQYASTDKLYLSLRRKDESVVQPTQLVIGSIPFKSFDINFDSNVNLPKLFVKGETAELVLSLPLFDYIKARSHGEIGSSLAPIHQSKIDWFHSELLKTHHNSGDSEEEIIAIKAGINGEVTLHNFILDTEQGMLEVDG